MPVIDYRIIIILAMMFVAITSIIYLKIRFLKRPYDYNTESELLSEFLYDEKTIHDGYDTTDLGDFERWKRNRKSKQ